MSTEDENRLLRELARHVAAEDISTFKIVLVKDAYQAKNLAKLDLVLSQRIPKERITFLGYMASDAQNAILLAKRNDIVIVPTGIAINRPCEFHPPLGAKQVTIFRVIDNKFQVSRHTWGDTPFSLKAIFLPKQEE